MNNKRSEGVRTTRTGEVLNYEKSKIIINGGACVCVCMRSPRSGTQKGKRKKNPTDLLGRARARTHRVLEERGWCRTCLLRRTAECAATDPIVFAGHLRLSKNREDRK